MFFWFGFSDLLLRGFFATVTAFFFSVIIGPAFIRYLQRAGKGQVVRTLGPKSHYSKAGTPTMGGLLIFLSMTISVLLWGRLSNPYLWLVILVGLFFSGIGFLDDYLKIIKKDSGGLPARWKYFLQSLFALIAAICLYVIHPEVFAVTFAIPFAANFHIALGLGFIVLAYFVIVGSSNAVNLTDGLDGLAIAPVSMIAAALGVMAYVVGSATLAPHFTTPYVAGSRELLVYCASMLGAGLGFLWYNTYPAQVFMGDVGALGLGASLGVIAVILRQEIALFIMSGVFVLETVSVIIQVGFFKISGGKRVFKMAPIHHHFELKGWAEPWVIVRFWIITFILVAIGLAGFVGHGL